MEALRKADACNGSDSLSRNFQASCEDMCTERFLASREDSTESTAAEEGKRGELGRLSSSSARDEFTLRAQEDSVEAVIAVQGTAIRS